MRALRIIFLLAAFWVVSTSSALAQTASVSPTSVFIGQTVTASWSGFSGNVNVAVLKNGSFWVHANTNVSGSGSQGLVTTGWEIRNDYSVKVELRSNTAINATSQVFEVKCLPPSAPTPTFPSNGSTAGDNTVDLTWSLPPNSSTFWVQVDNNSGFTSVESQETFNASGIFTTSPLAPGTYYWRVAARSPSPENCLGAFSSPSWTFVVPGSCGNGSKESGEQCDDGNQTSGDCCSSTCANENLGSVSCGTGACQRTITRCVNGVAQTCTPGSPGTEGPSGSPSCSNSIDDDCDGSTDSLDSGCAAPGPVCGDGAVVAPEQCDDGNVVSGDCCNSSCQPEAPGSQTCGQGVCMRTRARCSSGVPVTCVPGSPGTEGPFGASTCSNSLDDDCDGLTDAGDPNCASTSTCDNDNIKESGEACDGSDLGGATCSSQPGFTCGTLQCASCVLDTSSCGAHACTANDKQCVSATHQTCGDYDMDGCREWGANRSCPDGCIGDFCGPVRYAALGDSYSSGEGAGSYYSSTAVPGENECHRSLHAYSSKVSVPSLTFSRRFVACSGATMPNVNHGGTAQPNEGGDPPRTQLDQIAGEPWGMETITIGGNDVRFANILTYCAVVRACSFSFPLAAVGDFRTLAEIVEQNLAWLSDELPDTLTEVRQASPDVAVFVLGYPRIFSSSLHFSVGCLILGEAFDFTEREFLNLEADALNLVVQVAAARTGVRFVDVSFKDHEVCSPTHEEWLNGFKVRSAVESFHPNPIGQQRYATRLNEFVKAARSSGAALTRYGLPTNPAVPGGLTTPPRGTPDLQPPVFDELQLESVTPQCPNDRAFAPGQLVRTTGTGFAATEEVTVEFIAPDSAFTVDLGTAVASSDGGIDAQFVIPATAPTSGAAILTAVGRRGDGGELLLVGPLPLGPATDTDGDGVIDLCDACTEIPDPGQGDTDADGVGDACDACPADPANDLDNDSLCGNSDPFPFDSRNDVDDDGVSGEIDNCPLVANAGQEDSDDDARGDACEATPCHAVDLSTTPADGGGVSVTAPNCGPTLYEEGTDLALFAQARDGYTFAGWSGDVTTESATTGLVVGADTNVVAHFTPSACAATHSECRTASRSLLLMRAGGGGGAERKLVWRWDRGQPTSQDEFGDPTAATAYTLCLSSAGGPPLGLAVSPDPARWHAVESFGYRYKDESGSQAGIQKIVLNGSDESRSSLLFRGKGQALTLPALGSLSLPVTVRLMNDSTGVCFEATYDAEDVVASSPSLLKAKAR